MKEYVNYVYFDLFLASFQPANLGESPEVNQRDRQTDRQTERGCCEMDKKASGELVVESLFERQIMSGFQLASCRIATGPSSNDTSPRPSPALVQRPNLLNILRFIVRLS